MIHIFIYLSFIVQSNTIDSTILNLYHNDDQIQLITQELLENPLFHKRQCMNYDSSYQLMEIGNNHSSISALISCGIHARQLVTTELCLRFMESLKSQSFLTSNIHFRIFYQGNDQREKVRSGQQICKRTNKNDVDVNRNFPTNFKSNSQKQTYQGAYPLSQPFSQCLESEVKNKKPTIFLDIHSGQFSIFHTAEQSESQRQILQEIKKQYCRNCRLRTLIDAQGQIFFDLKARYGVKYSNLFEIYGAYKALLEVDDTCFATFNPLSKDVLQFYLERWNKLLVFYFDSIISAQI